ncbi:KGG domain-containing protein [Dyella choica]|uniref:General stress protein n=1 Tax=Dyella choica TaxID=1927959 RepID=A0A3S0R5J6_9GAMM|nr:KGG domain-containing protein [Dyella choica]RUL78369.1 hypothetical protein EKH80_05975 [Dyella choica]
MANEKTGSNRGGGGRGFAGMDEARQREIASQGGRAAHESGHAHEFSSEEARLAGRKGGESVSQNRQHMSAIGQKGGEAVSENREHMADIGRKGGEHSHGSSRQGGAGSRAGSSRQNAEAARPAPKQS